MDVAVICELKRGVKIKEWGKYILKSITICTVHRTLMAAGKRKQYSEQATGYTSEKSRSIPSTLRELSLLQRVHTGCEAQRGLHAVGIEGALLGNTALAA
jgi:hypothetical protein